MCGFTGFIDTTLDKKPIIQAMNDTIIHRGPDGEGFYIDEHIAMGFSRLSIIDLDHGNQPLFNEDKTYVLNFNGEIYNYQSIREDLIAKGHTFVTQSDSEVILHGYEEYKDDIVKHLRGMFAFVIYHIPTQTLFAARDHFGIKPFYYTLQDNMLIYGSEIKSFLKHPQFKKQLNIDAIQPYLTFQTSVLDETFFKGVFPLLPGHTMTYHQGKCVINAYHTLMFDPQSKTTSQKIHEVVSKSVVAHKIADVEVGSFLSSGVDSSYIASMSHVDKTFTVGFARDGFNECDEAEALAQLLKTQHYSKDIQPDEFFQVLSDVQYHMDEPHANLSAVPLFFLADMASKHVKVVLSGEGADELFGGYETYLPTKKTFVISKIPSWLRPAIVKILTPFAQVFPKLNPWIDTLTPIEKQFIGQAKIMSEKESRVFLKPSMTSSKSVDDVVKPWYNKSLGQHKALRKMHLDMNIWLNRDILTKADKMTMAHSLELRVPFLDKEVWEIARHIPIEQSINSTTTKKLFREAALSNIPEAWAKRKKLGFLVPFKFWILEDHYLNWIKAKFELDFVEEFFNQSEIINLLDKHKRTQSEARKIYTILCFVLWYERYFVLES
jgi:asparagine synthase (glutamine-hydrolysing)